ncbi:MULTISPECIES: DUF262 domain-containing protein [unclassified Variovorax]|uniref:DUF262 domain-containing protein n=1 Tax=unclassified Variovorax TaxID=663243 RepID=UPI003F464254
MFKKDPIPDIQRLEQLVASIRRGEIRLPKFQRPFVWDKDDMLDLWDSVYNGYPIGSVLLWHSSERLKSEREIYGFSVRESSAESYPTDYLLDGQQRLTTVCGALYWDGLDITSPWAIHFNLDEEKFTYPKTGNQINMFPLNKLLNTSDFIRQCMKFESLENGKKYYEAAERLLRSVKDYKIAVVKIGEVSLNEVAPIFERINSTGRKLTMVDLMRAATWKEGFDLTQAISDFSDFLIYKELFEIPEGSVLRGIAVAAGLGLNKGDIDKLRDLNGNELRQAFNSSREATVKALGFLREEMTINDFSLLPYGIQLTHISEFFRLAPNPTDRQVEILKEWFWVTSISKYFSGASTGQNSRDLLEIGSLAKGEVESISPLILVLDISALLFDEFNLRTSSSTTFCLLLRRALRDFSLEEMDEDLEVNLPSRKSRSDFFDFYKGTEIAGLNFGQLMKIHLDPRRIDVENFSLQGGFLNEEAVFNSNSGNEVESGLIRVEIISDYISRLVNRECRFNFPGKLEKL